MANYRTLFRKTPPARLKVYFDARIPDFPDDFDWSLKGTALVNSLDALLSNTGNELENSIRAELESILGIADRDGWRAVEEICRGNNIDLDGCEGEHDAIMMLALDHREIFERAISASSFKRRNGGRDWSAFELTGGRSSTEISDEAARERFVSKALAILGVPSGWKREADWYTAIRRDPITEEESRVTQATIYVEERPESSLAFGDGNSVEWRIVPRVGEVGVFYDAQDHVFEVYASGGKSQRDRYALAFVECFLGGAAEAAETPRREINFEPLLRKPVFEIDPADRIESYEVSQLSFYSIGGGFATFERRGDGESIYEFVERRFGAQSPVTARGWAITAATLRIVRNPLGGKGRTKTLTVDLKSPNRTTCRNKTEEDRIFVTGLFERWGLFLSRDDNGLLVEPG